VFFYTFSYDQKYKKITKQQNEEVFRDALKLIRFFLLR